MGYVRKIKKINWLTMGGVLLITFLEDNRLQRMPPDQALSTHLCSTRRKKKKARATLF